jgi:signal transduction histidine kinase
VAAETVSLIRPLADQHQIVLVGPNVACTTHVLGDRQRLKQVLLNLLSNAVKYNREGGSVHLACEPVPGERLRIKVTDTGLGIVPEALERLFVPFERVASQPSAIEGTGLGLPLSKRLAEAMGGALELVSTPSRRRRRPSRSPRPGPTSPSSTSRTTCPTSSWSSGSSATGRGSG